MSVFLRSVLGCLTILDTKQLSAAYNSTICIIREITRIE